jgi:hypothetical protein
VQMGRKVEKKGPPPADYVCAACKEGGHWVFDCSQVGGEFRNPMIPCAWRVSIPALQLLDPRPASSPARAEAEEETAARTRKRGKRQKARASATGGGRAPGRRRRGGEEEKDLVR